MTKSTDRTLAKIQLNLSLQLYSLAQDDKLLWEVARRAIEDELVLWRDGRMFDIGRNNGFVIKEKDGSNSNIIRFGPEYGVKVALAAIAQHIATEARAKISPDKELDIPSD